MRMKKIALLMLSLLCMLTAVAQGTVVTPPEGMETAAYGLKTQSFNYGVYTSTVMPLTIGFHDADVYIQGLCEYLPEAWIKGTREGNSVTFAKGQYFGASTGMDETEYPMYFGGCDESWVTTEGSVDMQDVVMAIDAEGVMTTATWMLVNSEATVVNPYVALTHNTIVPISDVAATPATPSIANFLPYSAENGYAGVSLTIPVADINGEPILVGKLSYRLFIDVEKDIQPLTIQDYDGHSFTEIPYTYTDNWNIEYGGYAVYWYEETAAINRIGVQTVYYGGGEERVSDIGWLDVKPYADEAATFDFNALDPATTPVSSSSSHAGDITTDLVLHEKDVTLTVSPSDGNTPNRYWKDYNLGKIQLRMYGGTMTFEVPEGCTIEKIFFNGEWNPYNEFDSGEMDNNQVWTGSTQKLVVYFFSGGSTGNSKINSIAVVAKGTTGVSVLTQQSATVLRTFDLLGRELPGDAKGLVIQQLRTTDGHVITKKVLRK